MGYRELGRVELREIVRRWQGGEGVRAIARATGMDRKTIAEYLRVAQAAGVQPDGGPPTTEQLTTIGGDFHCLRLGLAPAYISDPRGRQCPDTCSGIKQTQGARWILEHRGHEACGRGWGEELAHRRAAFGIETPGDIETEEVGLLQKRSTRVGDERRDHRLWSISVIMTSG